MKKLMTEWRQFINEQSAEERVAATAKRAKAFDAKMRKKHYGSETAEDTPENLRKQFINQEKRVFKLQKEDPQRYFLSLMSSIIGHLTGKSPTGFDTPEDPASALNLLTSAFRNYGAIDNNKVSKLMKAAGLPTSFKFDSDEDKRQKAVAASQPKHDKEIKAFLVRIYGADRKDIIDVNLKLLAGMRMRDPDAYLVARQELINKLKTKNTAEGVQETFKLMEDWHKLYMKLQGIIAKNLSGGKVFDLDTEEVTKEIAAVQQQMQQNFDSSKAEKIK